MQKLYSVQDIARMVDLTSKRVYQLGPELIKYGHAQKVGKVLVLSKTAVKHIKNRPDGRKGQKQKK
jgi:hypothetical protein